VEARARVEFWIVVEAGVGVEAAEAVDARWVFAARIKACTIMVDKSAVPESGLERFLAASAVGARSACGSAEGGQVGVVLDAMACGACEVRRAIRASIIERSFELESDPEGFSSGVVLALDSLPGLEGVFAVVPDEGVTGAFGA